ncbi:hypothetical protein L873DRAFT_1691926 [Choiromyces venosus 120613-1]|uniref:Uncharacterized protein n=1 Tax=Choiromyces venosus 120613-1 TaxID=1336337 RepID=A0A3N4JKC2_9PEZI|nr:hypothetical protein L873DRAFT_1691926 [Choiromyces venosus 120613-1]
MNRVKRSGQPAPSRRKKRVSGKKVDGIDKKDEEGEIQECIVVRLPGEIGARGNARGGVSTPKTTGRVARAVASAEHVKTSPKDKLPGARITRSGAQATPIPREPEQSAFTPINRVRARRSACKNPMHMAAQEEEKINGILAPPCPVSRKRKRGAEDTPEGKPPARRAARGTTNRDPVPTVEIPRPVLRRSGRKPTASHTPPVEVKRSPVRPAKQAKAHVIEDLRAVGFSPETDIDIPTEFEESNVRSDVTGAYP